MNSPFELSITEVTNMQRHSFDNCRLAQLQYVMVGRQSKHIYSFYVQHPWKWKMATPKTITVMSKD